MTATWGAYAEHKKQQQGLEMLLKAHGMFFVLSYFSASNYNYLQMDYVYGTGMGRELRQHQG